jgi:hypothetical protein
MRAIVAIATIEAIVTTGTFGALAAIVAHYIWSPILR